MNNINTLRRIAKQNGFTIKKGRGFLSLDNQGGYMITKNGWIIAGERFDIPEAELESWVWAQVEQEPLKWFCGWRQLSEYNRFATKALHCEEWLCRRELRPKGKASGTTHKIYYDGKWRDYTLYAMDEVEPRNLTRAG